MEVPGAEVTAVGRGGGAGSKGPPVLLAPAGTHALCAAANPCEDCCLAPCSAHTWPHVHASRPNPSPLSLHEAVVAALLAM